MYKNDYKFINIRKYNVIITFPMRRSMLLLSYKVLYVYKIIKVIVNNIISYNFI